MDLKKPQYQRTARIVAVVCGSFFCLFTFLYLWRVQGPVLGMAQHVLSNGLTIYNPLVGAFIITLTLWLIQFLISVIFNPQREWYALGFFPSFWILALVTSVHATVYEGLTLGYWIWLFPLGLLVFAVLLFLSRHFFHRYELRDGNLTLRILTPNLIVMLCLSLLTIYLGNTDEAILDKMHAEYLLTRGEYSQALQLGKSTVRPTKDLTALRAYALYRRNELGDHLFDYPQPYGADGLLLNLPDTARMLFSPLRLYRELGAYPRYNGEPALEFLELLELSEKARQPMTDQYLLCAYLLERKLNRFAEKMDQVYSLNDSVVPPLPHFYRQALVIYNRQHPERFRYRDKAFEAKYDEYCRTKTTVGSSLAARNLLRREFGTTYWWYYDTVNQ